MIANIIYIVGFVVLCLGTAHHVSKKSLFLEFISYVFLVPYYKADGYRKNSDFIVAWVLYVVWFIVWLWIVKKFYRGRWQETYQPTLDTFRFWWVLPLLPIAIVLLMFFFADDGWLFWTPSYVEQCGFECGMRLAWTMAYSVGHMMQPLVYLPQLWLMRNVYKSKDPATYQGSPIKTNVRLYLLCVLVVCIIYAVAGLFYFYQGEVIFISYSLTAVILATPWILRHVCRVQTGFCVKAGSGGKSSSNTDDTAKTDVEIPTPVTTTSPSTLDASGKTAPMDSSSVGIQSKPWEPEQPGVQETRGPGWSNIAPAPIATSSTATFVSDHAQNQKPTTSSRFSNPFSKSIKKERNQTQEQSDFTSVTPATSTAATATTTATTTTTTSQGWDTSWLV